VILGLQIYFGNFHPADFRFKGGINSLFEEK
jgi:hypothetical protein